MHSDSRKAQRNSFAHHRAELLFSKRTAFAGNPGERTARSAERSEAATRSLVEYVRASLLPAQAPALAAY